MKIHYNREKLQKITEDFSNLTGLDIIVTDRDYNELTGCFRGCAFCRMLQQDPEGKRRCDGDDAALLNVCRKSGRMETHVCNAGLTDIAVPIRKDGCLLGYLLFGRIRNSDRFSDIAPRLTWIGDRLPELEAAFSQLPFYNESQIGSIANIATAVSAYILSENMLGEDYDIITRRIGAYIDAHLTEQLSVGHLCKALNVTKNALYEHFHSDFHCTVSAYISRKRLELAKQLLIETDLSVQEIAERSGIKTYTYLFTLMKQSEGMTPQQYRKRYLDKYSRGKIYDLEAE